MLPFATVASLNAVFVIKYCKTIVLLKLLSAVNFDDWLEKQRSAWWNFQYLML